MIHSRLPLCLVLCVQAVIASHQCPHRTSEGIQHCVQPVAQYAKVLNEQESGNSSRRAHSQFGQAISLPQLGGEVFKELCRLIRNFDGCVYEYRKMCPKHITINLIDASYGYLCNEGYDTFMSSAECLMELDRKPSVKYCHDETLTDIESANHESGITMPLKLDRMCEMVLHDINWLSALNFFSSCVRLPIRHNCGVSAWSVIFRVLRDTTNTLMPGCQFTGQARRRTTPTTTTTTTTTTSTRRAPAKSIYYQADEDYTANINAERSRSQGRDKSQQRSGHRHRNPESGNEESVHYGTRQDGHNAPQHYTNANCSNSRANLLLIHVLFLSLAVYMRLS